MGIQFIHIDGYARVGSTQTITDKKTKQVKTKKKRSARDIANEVERVEGNTSHIENPKPPNIIFGCKPSEAVDLAEQWSLEAKDLIGRKLRKDGLCLLAGVISISRKDEAGWSDLKERSVSWLKETYGDRLKSIVEHQDEANPHLHFYVVPNKNETFAKIHHGFNAVEQVKKEQAEKKKETTEKKEESQTEIEVKGKAETNQPLEIYKIENGDTLQAFKVTGNAEVSIKSKGVYSMQVKQDSKTESLTEKLKEFSQNIVQENKIKERVSEMKKKTQEVNTKTGTFWSFGLLAIFGVVALLVVGLIIYFK